MTNQMSKARRKGAKLLHLLSRQTYRAGLRCRVAAAIEHEPMLRTVPVGTLIDVGANIGQFSLAARTHHPEAVIHAFEPLTDAADRFERLFRDDSSVRLWRLAAGATDEDRLIHIAGKADSSSLLPITALQERTHPSTREVAVATVPVRRLDGVLAPDKLVPPVVIKLDVQGFELEALKGMPRLLAAAAHVYAEVSFKPFYAGQPLAAEVIRWMDGQGWTIAGVFNPVPAENADQADVLFARAST